MFLVNESEMAVACDLATCVKVPNIEVRSAIDGFETQLRHIIMRGFYNKDDPFALGLLVMAITSASETYFRTVIACTATACPICHAGNVNKGRISFRAIDYYPKSMLVLALLEHIGFSDSDAIRKQTQELLQITVPVSDKGSISIAAALQNYDRVCALRHALIHSSGIINSQNSAEAGLQQFSVIAPSIDGLQMVADVCRNAILAFNQFLFDSIVSRLYQKGHLTGTYNSDERYMKIIVQLFLSRSSPSFTESLEVVHSSIHAQYGPKV